MERTYLINGEQVTASEAWAGYTGDQSVSEFMDISREQGYSTAQAAAENYVNEILGDPSFDIYPEEIGTIIDALAEYIERQTTC